MKKNAKQQGDLKGFNRLAEGLNGWLKSILSSLRLSLTFRIALHYCWQLLTTTLLSCLVVTLFFAGMQVMGLYRTSARVQDGQPHADGVYSQEVIQHSGVSARLTEEPYPTSGGGMLEMLFGQVFSKDLFKQPPVVCFAVPHPDGGTIRMRAEIDWALHVWGWLMIAVLAADVMRMSYFIRKRHRLDKRVLAPIRDMTEMAQTLSASNLSNRINVEGTKNELKDLAVVINTMLDRIERSYNSQKQFVSDASHELRTPIAVLQGYISMLSRWGKDDPTVLEESIAAIAQETASMKDLVESLLFLARHDKKTLMMEMERFDPCDVMAEVHKEAVMVHPEDTFVYMPQGQGLIEADRNMIKQVVRILCDNAVKYTPSGGRIVLGVVHTPQGCTLSVADNGPGISAQELPKIFDRFYRADSARKADASGHGLGLSIARIIIVAHGGKLNVRSKVGEGTTFSVMLPARQRHTGA